MHMMASQPWQWHHSPGPVPIPRRQQQQRTALVGDPSSKGWPKSLAPALPWMLRGWCPTAGSPCSGTPAALYSSAPASSSSQWPGQPRTAWRSTASPCQWVGGMLRARPSRGAWQAGPCWDLLLFSRMAAGQGAGSTHVHHGAGLGGTHVHCGPRQEVSQRAQLGPRPQRCYFCASWSLPGADAGEGE